MSAGLRLEYGGCCRVFDLRFRADDLFHQLGVFAFGYTPPSGEELELLRGAEAAIALDLGWVPVYPARILHKATEQMLLTHEYHRVPFLSGSGRTLA